MSGAVTAKQVVKQAKWWMRLRDAPGEKDCDRYMHVWFGGQVLVVDWGMGRAR